MKVKEERWFWCGRALYFKEASELSSCVSFFINTFLKEVLETFKSIPEYPISISCVHIIVLAFYTIMATLQCAQHSPVK